MATNKLTKGGAGGGMGSRQVTQKPQRLGQPARGINPGGPSQLGSSVGNHTTGDGGRTTNYRGDPWTDGRVPAGGNQRLGNQVAASTVARPGGSRQVMKSGGQGMHGSAAPGDPPPKGELFPGWPAKGRA
jgi:hypothetical protein